MIVQMLPTIAYGDAIGNHVIALKKLLESHGYGGSVYAENIDPRLPRGVAQHIKKYQDDENNCIIYHLSTGSELNAFLRKYKARIIIVYHNVTPSSFWKEYNRELWKRCLDGEKQVEALADMPCLCLADSTFNKNELIRMGYTCPIKVLPILIRFDDYKKSPDRKVLSDYQNDHYVNILFTGRIAPNKKIEDIITSFYYYKNGVNNKSRLILVGSYDPNDIYYQKLITYVEHIGLKDVIFTGHVTFEQVLAYYQIASVFLCLSEHEGFCVPLVEAMFFKVPVIAYDSTAVEETLGGAGLLLSDKNPEIVAEAIDMVTLDEKLRETMIKAGEMRLAHFDNQTISDEFLEIIHEFN